MAPLFGRNAGSQSSRLVYALFSIVSAGISHLRGTNTVQEGHQLAKRTTTGAEKIVFPILIPVLVLLSGLFAGLTLGYMSLDQTQLNVLSVSGTPEQKKYAEKIKPLRANGHLLLVTLLLANMIVNETLPVISDPVFGGIVSVVVSTALIVIFSEIIPQSLFTRYGLYLGAMWAGPTRVLIYALGIISYPTAKLLDWIVGHNNGVIYRRVELKELILMHSSSSPHGGDLNHDTAAIINATLDLQEKVVAQAMTPLSDVFMLHIDAELDFALLKKIVESGHSRIPVYEEVEVPAGMGSGKLKREIKIIGILLVKQCVLLDPKDATPVRSLRLNKVPFIPQNETLLGILDKFQEGRSHIAIVSRFSVEKAKSVKKEVKQTLTQRLKERVGIDGDSSDSSSSDSSSEDETEGSSTGKRRSFRKRFRRKRSKEEEVDKNVTSKGEAPSYVGNVEVEQVEMHKVESGTGAFGISNLEANMPADAVLAKAGANEFLQSYADPAIMPLGIITLEDVLEELIGEEIYDEFDSEGAHGEPLPVHISTPVPIVAPQPHHAHPHTGAMLAPLANVRNFSFLRSRSAPPIKRAVRGAPATSDTPNPDRNEEASTDPTISKEPSAPGITVTDETAAPKAKLDETATPPMPENSTPAAIEAMLLDRKRRKAQGAQVLESKPSVGPAAAAALRTRQGPKGKFKSGPLKKSSLNATLQEPPSSASAIPETTLAESPPATAVSISGDDKKEDEDVVL